MYDFGLSDQQKELTSSLRRYLDARCSTAELRKIYATPARFSEQVWRELADLGVLGLAVPQEYGGSGLGCIDLVAVCECLGRSLLPVPVIETLAVAHLIAKAGNEQQKKQYLPAIVRGELVATYAVDEADSFWSLEGIQARAVGEGRQFRLQGRKMWAPYLMPAGLVVVAALTPQTADRMSSVSLLCLDQEMTQSRVEILDAMDDTYQLGTLSLDGLLVPDSNIVGAAGGGLSAWEEVRRLVSVLVSAELVGLMEKSLEEVVAYSKTRTQFGKPIGSYQAVKHRCADILSDLEGVRGSVYYAAWALQQDLPDLEISISSAKAYASDAAVRTCEKALQTFGAIGFTWEHDIHFYLKRARRLEMSMGDASFHRERVAQLWL